ncbi:MAG: protein arginine kinase [Armatimonadetes bacterium]|nr:protein arginine kinase [Armatimonadota bacterium]
MALKKRERKVDWLKGEGPQANIVLISRIRLARNLEKIPFPHRAGKEDLKKIILLTKEAISKEELLNDFYFLDLEKISDLEQQVLIEEHFISPIFAQQKIKRIIYINPSGNLSIMINEEDHLRMQTLMSGLQLEEAWELIDKVDDSLEKYLDFAFHDKWGFLTTCPTNVGTGMRASIMLHLPALVLTNLMPKIIPTIVQLGLAVRGLYGEGTETQGNLFQISNQISLGLSEKDILTKIIEIASQIIEQEQNARLNLKKGVSIQLYDRIQRSFGIMRHARMITSIEALELLSMLRLGVDLKILPGIPLKALNELFILIKPASLQKFFKEELDPLQRDIKRADIIREKISKY